MATREATRGVRLDVGRLSGELDCKISESEISQTIGRITKLTALCDKYNGERGKVLAEYPRFVGGKRFWGGVEMSSGART